MVENLMVARPYAKALYSLAVVEDKLDLWYQALADIVKIVKDPKMLIMLKSPRPIRNLAMEILNEFSIADRTFKQFILMLDQEVRLQVLPEIFIAYELLYLQQNNTIAVIVKTVIQLNKDTLLALEKKLEDRFKRKIQVTVVIDEAIIGGAVIEVPEFDLVIDDSVKGKLKQLSVNLIM